MQDTDKKSETPSHVAIIMDGNGRWAAKRALPRTAGHKQGAEAARKVVRSAVELGVSYITLFGFSTENWSRPDSEIQDLMMLLRYYLRSETADLHKQGARLRVIGNRDALDDDIVTLINNAEELTRDNDNINVVIALNYGGRQDIIHAAKKMAMSYDKAELESMTNDAVADLFSNCLMTEGIPDPDLLIRTSGEQRISNFLLWQCAYTEFVFTDVLWPDFNAQHLQDAVNEYANRDRRFGAVKNSAKRKM